MPPTLPDPDSIERISLPLDLPLEEGERFEREETSAYESAQKKALLDAELAAHAQRQKFAPIIICIAIVWLVLLVVFMVLYGFRVRIGGRSFRAASNVMTALVSGGTVNVLGMLYAVIQYLFPKKTSEPKPEAKPEAT